MVWARHSFNRAYQDNHARNGARREKKRQTEEEVKNNIVEWTGMKLAGVLRETEDREGWRELVHVCVHIVKHQNEVVFKRGHDCVNF